MTRVFTRVAVALFALFACAFGAGAQTSTPVPGTPSSEQAPPARIQLGPFGMRPAVILKAPHHGSATSSSEAFIDALRPRAVIFSAGANNRFGHPAPVVVERFGRRGVEMFNTATDGAVFVETDGTKVEVRGWTGKKMMIR